MFLCQKIVHFPSQDSTTWLSPGLICFKPVPNQGQTRGVFKVGEQRQMFKVFAFKRFCVNIPKRLIESPASMFVRWELPPTLLCKRKTVWKRSKCKHLPLFAILNVPQKASSRTDLSLIHFNMAAIWSGNPTSCAAGSFNTIVDDHLSTLIPSLMNPNFELTAIGNEPLSFHHCQSLQCKSTVYLICLVMD